MKELAFIDLETDGLLDKCTKVHCAVMFTPVTGSWIIYADVPEEYSLHLPKNTLRVDTMYGWIDTLDYHTPVAHNGIQFDYKVLNKLFDWEYDLNKVVDTHILSRLYNPDRDGHSLAWWGNRLNFPKGLHSDWTKFSQEMLDYCVQDVSILKRVYDVLAEEANGWDWAESIKLENHVWNVMADQEQHGVLFDRNTAEALLATIEAEINTIEQKVLSEVPKKVVQVGATVSKPFKKDGSLTETVKKFLGDNYGTFG